MSLIAGIKNFTEQFIKELNFYKSVLKHPRTPKLSKLLLGGAIAYLASPFDLIPDFIPILGHLDDLIIVPFLIWLGMKLIPSDVIKECRLRYSGGKKSFKCYIYRDNCTICRKIENKTRIHE